MDLSGISEESAFEDSLEFSRGYSSLAKEYREFRVKLVNNDVSLISIQGQQSQNSLNIQNSQNQKKLIIYSRSNSSSSEKSTKMMIQTSLAELFVDESVKKKRGLRPNKGLRDKLIGS